MTNPEYVRNIQTGAMQLGIVSMCMQDFAAQIIRHVKNGGELDDAAFAIIKAKCIHNLKNVEGRGVPIEQEAEALNQALMTLEQFMNGAIANGRDLND